MLGAKGILTQQIPKNCYVASQLSQLHKHSESSDLLGKLLFPHVLRVPSAKVLSCKHERHFDLGTLISYH